MKTYAFANQFLVPELQRTVNQRIVEYLFHGDSFLNSSYMQLLIEEAFATIPADRTLLQAFVDVYCMRWTADDDFSDKFTPLNDLPHAFAIRAMRCLHGQVERAKEKNCKRLTRCYMEHASTDDESACKGAHIEYKRDKDYGFFHDRDPCLCDDCVPCVAEDTGEDHWP